MSTVALSQQWADTERRRQRAVILLLLLLLFLLALAPRNERRLFVFAGPTATGGFIEPPVQTLLRAAIFDPIVERVLAVGREPAEPAEPVFSPVEPDSWRDTLLDPTALMPEVDEAFLLSDLPQLPKTKPLPRRRPLFNRFHFGPAMIIGGPSSATGPVPEPASWLLMMLGVAMIGGRLRSGRRARPRSRTRPSSA